MKKRLRKIISLSAALMITMSAIVGCSSSKGDDSAQKSEGEQYGGILNISLSAVPKSLDPVKFTGVYEADVICNIADTLVAYNKEQTEIVPVLATEWEVENDGKSYVFKLRDDAYFQKGKFQDGRQMTAEDVKYSLERSSKESALNRLPSVDSVEVLGDYEVRVNLTSADATFLTNLTNAGNVIVPKEEVEGHGDAFGTNLVGTGPFSLAEFKKDSHAKLERHDNYWGEKPYLDGATFKFITDPNMTVNALRTGELDVATDVSGEGIEIIKNEKSLELKEVDGLHVAYIYMNQVEGPTKDKKVREAISMAIDREKLVQGIYQNGEANVASLPLPPGSWGYDESVEKLVPEYNVEEAKKLLAEAGYEDGFKTELYISDTPERVKMATIVQQMLKENLNIDVDIKTQEWGTFSEIGAKGNAPMFAMSWTWYPDPFFFLNKMFHSSEIGALGNGQGFNNSEVDALLDEALVNPDQEERAKLYKKALKLIVAETPSICYANEKVIYGVNKKVKGLELRADNIKQLVAPGINVYLEQ